MATAAFEKLTAMWHSGEIDDDEFKLATKYLKEELAKEGRADQPRQRSPMIAFSGWLLKQFVGGERLAQWPDWRRRLAELGMFLFVALAGFFIAQQTVTSLVVAAIEGDGAATSNDQTVGTQTAKAASQTRQRDGNGYSVSRPAASTSGAWYGRAVAVRDMWACRTEEAYNRSVSRAAEGRRREAEAEPGCMAFSPGQEAYVLPGGFMDGLKELTRFEVTGSAGETYEFVTGKDAFRKR
jgi:hypothetical protein